MNQDVSQTTNVVPRTWLEGPGIHISKIALGTAGWPTRSPFDKALAITNKAFTVGINMIDTSPMYRSESVMGELIRHADAPDDLVVVTKFSGTYDPDSGRRDALWRDVDARASVERSLKRLGRDYLDIVHLHDLGPKHLDYAFGKGGAIEAMVSMREQGLIHGIGLATYHPTCHLRALEDGRMDVLQLYHTYTLLNRVAMDEVFPLAYRKGVPIFNAGPYAGYILATGVIPHALYSYSEATPSVIGAVKRIQEKCTQKGVSIAQAAMAFSLRSKYVATTVVGASEARFIDDWMASLQVDLSEDDFDEILKAVGPSIEPLWLQVSRKRQRELIERYGDDWFAHLERQDHRVTKV